ncbi:MAG: hypothetical protein P4L58_00160, partial [Candidatus Pacebacteria bacterium]|nr:hypothetical protein [Candidatus Paceibacterota bacterium]
MTSKTKIILYSLAFFLIFLGFSGNANAAQIGNTIDWAWSGQLGWIHFNGSAATPDYGVTTTDGTGLTGYAWSEKGGYIKFSGTCSQAGGCPGGGNTYQVTASGTCAVGRECLSGWAWGAGIGWIHFAASGSNYANNSNTTYGVYIDSQGFFRGYAWNDQFGWIHFGGACTGGVGTCLNGEATYAVHEGPKNVYYSVGQSVSNLMTGSPTMNLTSGVATFSVAQTGNIGVGDRVTYNTSSVAYIASKTDSTGTDWQLVTATGGTPADVSVATVNSITHEYTSLAAAIAGATDVNHLNNTDLTVANVVLNIPCYYDSGSDTTAVTVSGYTTSAADYIKIYTPSNTTTYPAEANNSQRAMGKWDATKYNLQAGASSSSLLNILVPDVKIDGLQLYQSVGYYSSVVGLNSSGVVNLSVSNSIIRAFSGNTGNYGIIIEGGSTGSVYNIYNNIVYGASYDSGCNGLMVENSSVFLYNNTFYGNYTGIYGYSGTLIAKNNIVYNNTTDYSGSFDSSSTNNLSKDATAPGSNAEINRTVQFANAGANDFHLSLADTAALGHGANLSVDTNFAFDTDIDGQTRPTIWDIGADQSATAIYYSVGQNTNDHSSGGNVSISSGEATFDTPQTATNLGVGDVLTAGGNAYYISKKIDTSHWDVITALGATPADLSSTSVTSITHAFASLEGAVDASTASGAFDSSHLNTKDLVANNYQLNIPCYYDTGADTTAVTISGWTTGASNYIRIYTPKSLTTEANFSQRATGKWDNSKYSISANANVIYVQIENVHVDGLQVELNPTSDDGYLGIGVNSQSYIIDGFEASNNIVKQTTQKVDAYGVICYTGASTCKIWNNIVYGFSLGSAGRGSILVGGSSSTVAYVYNNTTYGNYIGIQELAGGEIFLNNNLSYNNGTDYDGSFDPSSTNNLSKDATAPAYGTYYRNATVTFVDATNDDFHLASTDTGAIGNGANLISDTYLPFSTDIDGQTRPATGAWDIGADESTSRVYYSVGQSASNLMTGAPTMTMVSGAAVLSVAQTGNIGVGDRVTYNTSQIAYIASKTDSSGTKWNLVTALGATPADVTTAVTVNSITHEYTSLAAAIAGASGANHINNLDL